MKKWVIGISSLATILVLIVALTVDLSPTVSPLTGRPKVVTITKQYFEKGALEMWERSLTITNAEELGALIATMKAVPQDLFGSNSEEGYPKYHMNVTYDDGRSNQFMFTRHEWGFSGHTPKPLLEYLDKNGL